uniref:Putative secreted protein n=1 Tax=Ixodes ricinus TaxID=34613 RepID=A0A6B0V229_IXORI
MDRNGERIFSVSRCVLVFLLPLTFAYFSADGTDWEPTRHSRICSVHFVGGASSKDVSSPSYAPTMFPEQYRKRSVLPEDKSGRYERYKKRRTATAALPQTSTSLPDLLQAEPPTVVTEAPVDLPASPAFAPEFEEPGVTGEHNEARHQEGVEVSTQTSWTSEPQDQGVLMISCTLWTGACEASTQVSYFAHERPTTADASIAAVSLRDH